MRGQNLQTTCFNITAVRLVMFQMRSLHCCAQPLQNSLRLRSLTPKKLSGSYVTERNTRSCYLWFKFIDDEMPLGADRANAMALKLDSRIKPKLR